MTRDEFKQLENILNERIKQGKISAADKEITLATLKVVYGRCITCNWNDGLPHSACYNCD